MSADLGDGYKVLTYLHGEKTAELPCRDRSEAQELLTALTSRDTRGVVSASDMESEESPRKIECDKAEMWRNGELIAFGIMPDLYDHER